MLQKFLRLFEGKRARTIRLARERAERRRIAREVELALIEKNNRDRVDLRHGPSQWIDSIAN